MKVREAHWQRIKLHKWGKKRWIRILGKKEKRWAIGSQIIEIRYVDFFHVTSMQHQGILVNECVNTPIITSKNKGKLFLSFWIYWLLSFFLPSFLSSFFQLLYLIFCTLITPSNTKVGSQDVLKDCAKMYYMPDGNKTLLSMVLSLVGQMPSDYKYISKYSKNKILLTNDVFIYLTIKVYRQKLYNKAILVLLK